MKLISFNRGLWNRMQRMLGWGFTQPVNVTYDPVIVANAPDFYSEYRCKPVEIKNASSTDTLGVVADVKKDVYITDVILYAMAGTEAPVGAPIYLQALINGGYQTISACAIRDGSQGEGQTAISFNVPIKIDNVTNNLKLTTSAEVSAVGCVVHGYQL